MCVQPKLTVQRHAILTVFVITIYFRIWWNAWYDKPDSSGRWVELPMHSSRIHGNLHVLVLGA